jgi:creatine kinase
MGCGCSKTEEPPKQDKAIAVPKSNGGSPSPGVKADRSPTTVKPATPTTAAGKAGGDDKPGASKSEGLGGGAGDAKSKSGKSIGFASAGNESRPVSYLETGFPMLESHNNWMAKVLTPEMYNQLKDKKTTSGFTLDMAIQTGVDNPGHPYIYTVGCVAGDEESYHLFADLMDPVIDGRHNGYSKNATHRTDLDYSNLIGGDDLDDKYVLSCRVRTGRSIRGFSLPPHCTRAERRELERILRTAGEKLQETSPGVYYSLKDMTDEHHEQLIEEHIMFDKPVSTLLTASGMARDWPDGRGIWHNNKKTFIIWVNEEDHARFVSMQNGGNMLEVFKRFATNLKILEDAIFEMGHEFMWNEHLGYILTCPSNLGTGLRAGVHVKLPLLSQHSAFDDILLKLRLQKRGTGGVDTASTDGIFDISNLDRLGKSEVELAQLVIDGVQKLIQMEKRLEGPTQEGKDAITDLYPSGIHPPTDGFPDITEHNNWMAKSLTPAIYWKLKDQETSSGCTVDICIQQGVDNPGDPENMISGLQAGDEQCYTLFQDLFDEVIKKCHNGYMPEMKHLPNLNPAHLNGSTTINSEYVISCRIRLVRNIRSFCLAPMITRGERRAVARIVQKAFANLDDNLKGTYTKWADLDETCRKNLEKTEHGKLASTTAIGRDWPDARGVYSNEDKNFFITVNEGDHIRMIAIEKSTDVGKAFTNICEGVHKLHGGLLAESYDYMWSEHHGYMSTSVGNIGTAMRISIRMKIPQLSAHEDFVKILQSFQLMATGPVCKDKEPHTFDISNTDRLGVSEVQLMQTVIRGIHTLTEMEQCLEGGKDINDLLPPSYWHLGLNANAIIASRRANVRESNFPDLSKHNNMLSKVLTQEMYNNYSHFHSRSGMTLDYCIQTGVDNIGTCCDVGAVVADEECLILFPNLFYGLLEKYHGFTPVDNHQSNFDSNQLKSATDLNTKYVMACRIRGARSLRPYPLVPALDRYQRRVAADKIKEALEGMKGVIDGVYYPYAEIPEDVQKTLKEHGLLYCKPCCPKMISTGMARDWPDGRGIWYSTDMSMAVWVNEKDHLRVITQEAGGNMKAIYEKYGKAMDEVEKSIRSVGLEIMANKHIGHINCSPADFGTAMKVSVIMKIPNVQKHSQLDEIMKKLYLQKRVSLGCKFSDAIEISNFRRLGMSEVDYVQHVVDNCRKLSEMETKLENGDSIADLLP